MTKKEVDWVVMGGKPGEIGYCSRCGQGLTVNLPQPIPIFVACPEAFAKMHSGCKPRQYHEKPAQTPIEWASGRDTGTSSLTIYSILTGLPSPHGHYSVPWDPADFGRCYRLLKLFPAWRGRLGEVAEKEPTWKPLVREWDALTRLYEEELPKGKAPKLYDRMKELLKEVGL